MEGSPRILPFQWCFLGDVLAFPNPGTHIRESMTVTAFGCLQNHCYEGMLICFLLTNICCLDFRFIRRTVAVRGGSYFSWENPLTSRGSSASAFVANPKPSASKQGRTRKGGGGTS